MGHNNKCDTDTLVLNVHLWTPNLSLQIILTTGNIPILKCPHFLCDFAAQVHVNCSWCICLFKRTCLNKCLPQKLFSNFGIGGIHKEHSVYIELSSVTVLNIFAKDILTPELKVWCKLNQLTNGQNLAGHVNEVFSNYRKFACCKCVIGDIMNMNSAWVILVGTNACMPGLCDLSRSFSDLSLVERILLA